MGKVIRISDETFSRLQQLAEPLVDTPASVIDKLLDQYESGIKTSKSLEKRELYTVSSNHNLFLVPADKSNIKQSIQKKVRFEDASLYLNHSDKNRLRSILGQDESFNCWAMTESNRSMFNRMEKGDYVLLTIKGTGKFDLVGKIKGKLESESLGNKLWSFTPGKPWSLIYLLDDLKAISIDKQKMVQLLGYKSNFPVYGSIRVQKQNLNVAIANYGDIESLINALNES